MLNSEKYSHKKNMVFLNSWEEKRKNRLKYSLKESLTFAIPFCIIFQLLEGIDGFLTLKFLIKVLVVFCVYFLLSYYVSFNLFEKKYFKLKKK